MDADRAALAEENAALKAELAVARAKASEDAALIVQQTLRIAKLERQVYGQKSERSARLIEQLALTFENWKRTRRKTNWRRSRQSPKRRRLPDLRASALNATRSQTIFRASGW
jgi:hypothetical protein